MKNNENGRSMVEMLGVLAIIGVLSAGGLAGYSKAMFKHKLNSTMEQITMLVTNIRTMYGTQGNYNGLSKITAYKLGVVPAVMADYTAPKSAQGNNPAVTEATVLTNPFKGDVDIAPVDIANPSGTNNDTGFKVVYGGLPKEACIALATADFGSGAGSGFIGAQIGSAVSGQYGEATEGNAFPMADTTSGAGDGAISVCSSEDNTITWYFY